MDQLEATRKHLISLKEVLPSLILDDHLQLRPDLAELYQDHQLQHYMKDIGWILEFLSEAIWAQQPVLFIEFIQWLKSFLHSVKVPQKDTVESFELLKNRLKEFCSDDELALIYPILDEGIRTLSSDDKSLSLVERAVELSDFANHYL